MKFFSIFFLVVLSLISPTHADENGEPPARKVIIKLPKPAEGPVGEPVTLHAEAFQTDKVRVSFTGRDSRILVTGVSATDLKSGRFDFHVKVPTGAVSGPILVTNLDDPSDPVILHAGFFKVLTPDRKQEVPFDDMSRGGVSGKGTTSMPPDPVKRPGAKRPNIKPEFHQYMDLPVEDPKVFLPPLDPPPPPAPPKPEETHPKFMGRELNTASRSLVYVLDTSGSMRLPLGQYQDLNNEVKTMSRLDRAKVELARSIQLLPEDFEFNIVTFSCEYRFFKDTGLVKATKATKDEATQWVFKIAPFGETGTAIAVENALALSRKNKHIVLLTDGEPNCGLYMDENFCREHHLEIPSVIELHRKYIRTANIQRANIDVYAIGAYNVFEEFCRNVASDNAGSYQKVQ